MPEKHPNIEETDSLEVVSNQPATREISWRVHPLVENWKRSILLLFFLMTILIVIYAGFQSFIAVFLSVFFLILPLYPYFLPVQYHIGENDLIVRSLLYKHKRPWSSFRSYYVDKNGVLLSPFVKPSRLENFRGIYVRFGKHPPEDIVNNIDNKINLES